MNTEQTTAGLPDGSILPLSDLRLGQKIVAGFLLLLFLYLTQALFKLSPACSVLAAALTSAAYFCFFAYGGSIRKTRRLHTFRPEGRVAGWLSGKALLIFLNAVLSFVLAYGLLLWLGSALAWQWLFLAASFLFFACLNSLLDWTISKESVAWLRSWRSISLTIWLCLPLYIAAYGLCAYYLQTPVYAPSLPAAWDSLEASLPQMNSPLANILLWLQIFPGGAADHLLWQLSQHSGWLWLLAQIILLGLGSFSLLPLWGLACLPAGELPRPLAPPTPAEKPVLPGTRDLLRFFAPWLAVLALLSGLLYLTGLWTQRHEPEIRGWIDGQRQQVVRIYDNYYRAEVLDRVNLLSADYAADLAALDQRAAQALAEGFSQMEANVDLYLDWYYSLGAEYARLVQWTLGDLSVYLENKLVDHLESGGPFARFETIQSQYAYLLDGYQADLEQALSGYLADDSSLAGSLLRPLNPSRLLTDLERPESISLEARLGASLGGGLVAGIGAGIGARTVVKRVAGSVATRQALGNAAEAIVKQAAKVGLSRAGSTLAGAAAGTVIMPGPGTLIGAVGGFVVGIGTGLLVDSALLNLEEALNRENFKQEILAQIQVLKDSLLTAPDAAGPAQSGV